LQYSAAPSFTLNVSAEQAVLVDLKYLHHDGMADPPWSTFVRYRM
jgi:hypothetical protein